MIYVSLLLVLIAVILFVTQFFLSLRNSNTPKPWKKGSHYAILIPAREESKVIEELLVSIENQTKKVLSEDVYVIVERKDDPTVEIVQKHHMHICYRKDLSLKRKGYALNDIVKEIQQKNVHYDAYFIMDADNVLDENFIASMEQSMEKGYDIGIGYRNCKNGNDSMISAVSALTFSMINTLGNKFKTKHQKNLILSGTGFYIKGDLLESWKGYPFHTLTEDYELSIYAVLKDCTMTYNKDAIFYDEQPTKYHQTFVQRTRWIRGYLDVRKKYFKQLYQKKKNQNYASLYSVRVGVLPVVLLLVGFLLLWFQKLLECISAFVFRQSIIPYLLQLLLLLFFIYLVLQLFTIVILIKEERVFHLNLKRRIQCIFFNPLYLLTYVPCFLVAIFKKEIGWKQIIHEKEMKHQSL